VTTDWHRHPLALLMSVYFDQDWDLNGNTPLDVLESFRDDEPDPVVQQAYDEVVGLLSRNLEEPELEEELDRLGLQYYPPGDGLTHRQWLEQVADILKRQRPTNGGGRP
jgi:contact-dependent growth inhibition (CDI) system CdiI-like immunity protein